MAIASVVTMGLNTSQGFLFMTALVAFVTAMVHVYIIYQSSLY